MLSTLIQVLSVLNILHWAKSSWKIRMCWYIFQIATFLRC